MDALNCKLEQALTQYLSFTMQPHFTNLEIVNQCLV